MVSHQLTVSDSYYLPNLPTAYCPFLFFERQVFSGIPNSTASIAACDLGEPYTRCLSLLPLTAWLVLGVYKDHQHLDQYCIHWLPSRYSISSSTLLTYLSMIKSSSTQQRNFSTLFWLHYVTSNST